MKENKNQILRLRDVELADDILYVKKRFENLTFDSKILIDDLHCAILIKDGEAYETYDSGVYKLYEKKRLFSSNDNKVRSRIEFFYVSKTAIMKMLWGTPYFFEVHDPKTDTLAKMGASGELELRIKNPRQFCMEVAGSKKTLNVSELKTLINSKILSIVEEYIPEYIENADKSICHVIEDKLSMSRYVEEHLRVLLSQSYGIEVVCFTISNLNLPDKFKEEVQINSNPLMMDCPMCGNKIAQNSKFCNNCGFKIRRVDDNGIV